VPLLRRAPLEPPPERVAPARRRALSVAPWLPESLRRYTKDPYRWRPGNEVTLLRAGGEAYPAMLAAIAAAGKTIHFETYIFEDDHIGRRFGDALIERAAAGVVVRLLYDAIGGLALSPSFVAKLRSAGIEVVEYRPIAPWRRRWGWFQRDHRKILVVDDEVAFTGGINIGDEYAAVEDGGKGWHDIHCRVRGPIVLDLVRTFRRVWRREGGSSFPAPPRPKHVTPRPRRGLFRRARSLPPEPGVAVGSVAARVLDNTERRRRRIFRRSYLAAVHAARELVYVENAYFLPDRGVRAALIRAVERGVDVAVIVPGRSDIKAIEYAGLWIYRRLIQRGLRILCWRGTMMHAKTAVVDGVWSTIGSYNLDYISLHYNLEVTVEALDPTLGSLMVAQFRHDVAQCDSLDLSLWDRLPWWKKALAWLAFRFRRWL